MRKRKAAREEADEYRVELVVQSMRQLESDSYIPSPEHSNVLDIPLSQVYILKCCAFLILSLNLTSNSILEFDSC